MQTKTLQVKRDNEVITFVKISEEHRDMLNEIADHPSNHRGQRDQLEYMVERAYKRLKSMEKLRVIEHEKS